MNEPAARLPTGVSAFGQALGRALDGIRWLALRPAVRAPASDQPTGAYAAHVQGLVRLVAYCLPGKHAPILCIGPQGRAVAAYLDALGYTLAGASPLPVPGAEGQGGAVSGRTDEREPDSLARFDDLRFGVTCLDLATAAVPEDDLRRLLAETARVTRSRLVWAGDVDASRAACIGHHLADLGFRPMLAPAEPLPHVGFGMWERALVPAPHPDHRVALSRTTGRGGSRTAPTVEAAATSSRHPEPARPMERPYQGTMSDGHPGVQGPLPAKRPLHFDVDLSRPGSFTWITAELAQALLECGHQVSIRPGAISDTLPEHTRALLAPLANASPDGATVIGWNHFHDTPGVERQIELFAINYRFRGRDPAAFDPWMQQIRNGRSTLLAISEYCRQVLLDAGVPDARCAVLPLGYSPEADWVETRAHLPARRTIKILAVTNAHDVTRYGTDLLLEAYARAFRPDDDVALVLRDYGAYNADVDRRLDAMRAAGYEALYFARFLDKNDVVRFYRGCDVFVAPFRGEGFGVKVLDALACGLPVIAPHYGGPADYLTDTNSTPVAYREVPVGDCLDRRSLTLGNDPTWCEVDVDDLAAKLVATRKNLPAARHRAMAARRVVRDRFHWHRIAERLTSLVDQCAPIP